MAGKQGFASMDKSKQREIARKGAAAQPLAAKRLGGQHSHLNR
jgi:general stress protein YciG